MNIIQGDIFKELSDNRAMLHICNDAGGYGGGPTAIATQVKNKYPTAYESYKFNQELGDVSCDEDYKVFNLVAQRGYGKRGKRYLNYGALSMCLWMFMDNYNFELQDQGVTEILIPKNMGADRAGGDFEIVMEMVEFIIGTTFKITVVEFVK